MFREKPNLFDIAVIAFFVGYALLKGAGVGIDAVFGKLFNIILMVPFLVILALGAFGLFAVIVGFLFLPRR